SKEFFEGVPNVYEIIKKCKKTKEISGDNFNCNLGVKIEYFEKCLNSINDIIDEIDEISNEMNFNFLYDTSRGLFSIGYNVEENSLGNSYYDLLASECR
ncbi:hypothetical protein KFV96_28765, partial [Klebsiella pneumoniae]|nr:hypothetical protein [Klebsiella pneumoniae]